MVCKQKTVSNGSIKNIDFKFQNIDRQKQYKCYQGAMSWRKKLLKNNNNFKNSKNKGIVNKWEIFNLKIFTKTGYTSVLNYCLKQHWGKNKSVLGFYQENKFLYIKENL